jgi:hypothetical protein
VTLPYQKAYQIPTPGVVTRQPRAMMECPLGWIMRPPSVEQRTMQACAAYAV